MELKDLIGSHELSGVDVSTEDVTNYGETQQANVVRFILDGKTYKATEDPNDGYRSYCNELQVCEDKLSNTFPPHKVTCKMKENDTYGLNNTLQFTDEITGKVVLEVGTDNYDDYYPCCILSWHPENLAINVGK